MIVLKAVKLNMTESQQLPIWKPLNARVFPFHQ